MYFKTSSVFVFQMGLGKSSVIALANRYAILKIPKNIDVFDQVRT